MSKTTLIFLMCQGKEQKADDRGQRAEGRGGREQRAEDRWRREESKGKERFAPVE